MTSSPTGIVPYEGDKDFIFVSYSHRDSAKVLPLIEALCSKGCRIWYDEGIDPGTEWPESIAAHLSACKVCLAFISPNSVDSVNCRREINYALSKGKGFLSVMLEPMQMSPGMEMQISSYQSIISYKYPTKEAFLARLTSIEMLKSCSEKSSASPAPAAEPAPKAVPPKAEPGVNAPAPGAQGSAPQKPIQQGVPRQGAPQRPIQQGVPRQGAPQRPIQQGVPRQDAPQRPIQQGVPQQGAPQRPIQQGVPRPAAPDPSSPAMPRSIKGWKIWSIITIILCLVPGIIALTKINSVNKCKTIGEQNSAIKTARICCIIGTAVGGFIWMFILVGILSSGSY